MKDNVLIKIVQVIPQYSLYCKMLVPNIRSPEIKISNKNDSYMEHFTFEESKKIMIVYLSILNEYFFIKCSVKKSILRIDNMDHCINKIKNKFKNVNSC